MPTIRGVNAKRSAYRGRGRLRIGPSGKAQPYAEHIRALARDSHLTADATPAQRVH
jgi:hypothetical protein